MSNCSTALLRSLNVETRIDGARGTRIAGFRYVVMAAHADISLTSTLFSVIRSCRPCVTVTFLIPLKPSFTLYIGFINRTSSS